LTNWGRTGFGFIRRKRPQKQIDVTPEMTAAGEVIVLGKVGGADLGAFFDPRELAIEVYLAMVRKAKCHQ